MAKEVEQKIKQANLHHQLLHSYTEPQEGFLHSGFTNIPLFDRSEAHRSIEFFHHPSCQNVSYDMSSYQLAEENTASSAGLDASLCSFKASAHAELKSAGFNEKTSMMVKNEWQNVLCCAKLSPHSVRALLLPSVQKFIESAPPHEVFDELGMFYATELSFGAKWSQYISTESREFRTVAELRAAFGAGGFGITGNAESQINVKSSSGWKTCTIIEKGIGGDPHVMYFADKSQSKEQLKKWQDSTRHNLAIVHVKLSPIFNLAGKSERKDELKTAHMRRVSSVFSPKPRELPLEQGRPWHVYVKLADVGRCGDMWISEPYGSNWQQSSYVVANTNKKIRRTLIMTAETYRGVNGYAKTGTVALRFRYPDMHRDYQYIYGGTSGSTKWMNKDDYNSKQWFRLESVATGDLTVEPVPGQRYRVQDIYTGSYLCMEEDWRSGQPNEYWIGCYYWDRVRKYYSEFEFELSSFRY